MLGRILERPASALAPGDRESEEATYLKYDERAFREDGVHSIRRGGRESMLACITLSLPPQHIVRANCGTHTMH